MSVAADGAKVKALRVGWQEIIENFIANSAYSYCSGELAITVLVFDSLVKLMEDPNL